MATITYPDANDRIQVVGDTPNFLQDIYDEDQANGWGVFHKQGNRQFHSEKRIILGDSGGTSTTVSDKRASLEFAPEGIPSGGIGIDGITYQNTHPTFGELVDEAKKIVKYGVDFLYPTKGTGVNRYLIYASDAKLYGCSVRGFSNSYYSLWLRGTLTLYHCTFDWASLYNAYLTAYNLLFLQQRMYSLFNVSGVMDEIRAFGGYLAGSQFIHVEATSGITVSNAIARGYSKLYGCWLQTGNSYLINVDSDTWDMQFSESPNAKVYRQYKLDATCIDKTGSPLNEVSAVGEYINPYGQAFSVLTGPDGKIATQTIDHGFFDQAHGSTEQLKTPLKVTYGKPSYQTVPKYYPIDEKTNDRVVTHKAVGVFLDLGMPDINLKKTDPENKMVMAL